MGCRRPDIAERLTLSTATVKSHLQNLYGKLEVNDRAAAVAVSDAAGPARMSRGQPGVPDSWLDFLATSVGVAQAVLDEEGRYLFVNPGVRANRCAAGGPGPGQASTVRARLVRDRRAGRDRPRAAGGGSHPRRQDLARWAAVGPHLRSDRVRRPVRGRRHRPRHHRARGGARGGGGVRVAASRPGRVQPNGGAGGGSGAALRRRRRSAGARARRRAGRGARAAPRRARVLGPRDHGICDRRARQQPDHRGRPRLACGLHALRRRTGRRRGPRHRVALQPGGRARRATGRAAGSAFRSGPDR